MTREQFRKYSYRYSEVMIFHHKHPPQDIEMILLGVDFDNERFHLYPVMTDYYEEQDYWMPYERVDKPQRKPKMKVIVSK